MSWFCRSRSVGRWFVDLRFRPIGVSSVCLRFVGFNFVGLRLVGPSFLGLVYV